MNLAIDAINIRQGGGVTHLSQLLHAADPTAAGFSRVTVWSSTATASLLPDMPWLIKRSEPWMEAVLPLRLLGMQLQLPRALIALGCDVLFSPGGTLPAWCPVPVVTMSQNMLPFEPCEAARFGRFSLMRFKLRLLRFTQGRSFQRADGMIFLTQYAATAVTKALGAAPMQSALVPHGIEQRFVNAPRPQRRLSDCTSKNPFRVLYVSILMPYKHQVQVAHAICKLRSEGVPIEMRFIGASWGKYGRDFKALLDELDPKREFLLWSGAEPFDTLHDFYKKSDAFAFASSCENMPNILIEAMAAGLPIACSDRGPMPEVLGDAGIYFDPDNSSSIAIALSRLAQDSQLRSSLADKAWRKAQVYSWERCAHDTFAFIAQVVRGKLGN